MSMMDTSPKYDNISPLLEMEDRKIKQMIKELESRPLHKCLSPDCKNQTNVIWCNDCFTELGEYIEQHPISSHRNISE